MVITVFAAIAALSHVGFFWLESVLWNRPGTAARFGMKREQAEASRLFALNQGFYNLFLAVVMLTGLVLRARENAGEAGYGMLAAASAVMVGAGVVLFISAPRLRVAALVQAVPPGVVLTLVGVELCGG